uniref:J domain-containing protein n=1 Tax=Lotharella globosa TaxID=91324 RepID=A0A6V3MWF3_9EUKA|mmetsp:Transcript_12618/g.25729  ORF Transcript_12618/g.25729 Transcript_12618/m.25729 type:complete len:292 (-) Transcript_12618:113-988(-)|eukprot:CAMPEP_0167813536 /NCGR_PEP_ID=MMETSP0112_2-20121227/1911_1 /TAXON_ID=91324 /ORGANISM="Lotharella globosa, Strain CCCM811" /LENGTH=291 /DNA_ID=CAMNT_0007712635 /DNA_START=601 /DNA_END=1476 /DNA_ORIENTATION=-
MTSSLSVRQIKDILDKAGVDYSDCCEKKDLQRKLEDYRRNARPKKAFDGDASTDYGSEPQPSAERKRPASGSERKRPANGATHSSSRGARGSATDVTSLIRQINKDEDYYDILGVPRDATDIDLKKAYRKLALKLHPDKCSEDGAEDAFKKVGAAYHCLSDSDKRRRYDLSGTDSEQAQAGGHPDVDEIFRQMFGQGGMHGGPGVRFHFGGPGMFFHHMGGQRQGQQQQQQQHVGLMQYLPILVMLLINLGPGIIRMMATKGFMLLFLLPMLPSHLRRPALLLFLFVAFFL